jgi:hypothetical protein
LETEKIKVFIATPVRRVDVMMFYTQAVSDLRQELLRQGIDSEYKLVGNEAVVEKGRNYLTWAFLESDCTHLLFVDDDMAFSSEHAIRMIKSGKHLIGGAGAKKWINWQRLEKTHQGKSWLDKKHASADVVCVPLNPKLPIMENEPFEVKHIGAALMCITRELAEKMRSVVPTRSIAHPNSASKILDVPWWFSQGEDENGKNLTEDYMFCKHARDLGYQVFLAPWVHLKHVGFQMFEGCIYCSNGSIIHQITPRA